MDLAAKIDRQYCRSKDDMRVVTDDAYNSVRTLWRKIGGDTFCDMLSHRQCFYLDPSGMIRQKQMPIQVGCTEEFWTRLNNYGPGDTGFQSNTPMMWALTVSCLAVMGIELEIIRIPIAQIWKPRQLPIVEVLLTTLAGSLIHWGGMNSRAAGTTTARKVDFSRGERSVFVENQWASANLTESLKRTSQRVQAFESVEAAAESKMDDMLQDISKHVQDTSTKYKSVIDTKDCLVAAISELEARNEHKKEAISKKRDFLSFAQDIDDWLN